MARTITYLVGASTKDLREISTDKYILESVAYYGGLKTGPVGRTVGGQRKNHAKKATKGYRLRWISFFAILLIFKLIAYKDFISL